MAADVFLGLRRGSDGLIPEDLAGPDGEVFFESCFMLEPNYWQFPQRVNARKSEYRHK